jgi:hypothetical protein
VEGVRILAGQVSPANRYASSKSARPCSHAIPFWLLPGLFIQRPSRKLEDSELYFLIGGFCGLIRLPLTPSVARAYSISGSGKVDGRVAERGEERDERRETREERGPCSCSRGPPSHSRMPNESHVVIFFLLIIALEIETRGRGGWPYWLRDERYALSIPGLLTVPRTNAAPPQELLASPPSLFLLEQQTKAPD